MLGSLYLSIYFSWGKINYKILKWQGIHTEYLLRVNLFDKVTINLSRLHFNLYLIQFVIFFFFLIDLPLDKSKLKVVYPREMQVSQQLDKCCHRGRQSGPLSLIAPKLQQVHQDPRTLIRMQLFIDKRSFVNFVFNKKVQSKYNFPLIYFILIFIFFFAFKISIENLN